MTNPRDDLMALALEAYNKVWNGWPDPIDAANVEAVRFAAMKAALAASRSATQVVDRETVARLAERFWRIHPKELQDKGITRKQFYEQEILSLFRPAEPVEPTLERLK